MDRFLQFLRNLRQRLFSRNRQQVIVIERGNGQQQARNEARPNMPPHFNAAAYALHEIFPSRHAAEEQVVFRPVNQQGMVVQQIEEWLREGNSMRTRLCKTMVVTCSGAIVAPDRLQGMCWCGGYDDQISRCAACARPLCRLHTRVFVHPTGQLIFCDLHYREALDAFNTWAALDRNRNKTKST